MALFEVNSGPFWLDLVQFGSYLGPLQTYFRFNCVHFRSFVHFYLIHFMLYYTVPCNSITVCETCPRMSFELFRFFKSCGSWSL